MSGEIDLRRYAGSPAIKPRYLSDSPNNFYGAWTPGVSLSWAPPGDDAPVKDAISKMVLNVPGAGYNNYIFTFRQPQNIKRYVLDFWSKAVAGTPTSSVYCVKPPGIWNYYGNYGITPTTWTHYGFPLEKCIVGYLNWDKNQVQESCIQFYLENSDLNPWVLEMIGLTLRRL